MIDSNDSPSPQEAAQLDAHLDLLRCEIATLETRPQVEKKLMAAFAAQQRKQQMRERFTRSIARWFAPGIGLAASIGVAAWFALAPMQRAIVEGDPSGADLAINARPFIALQSLEQIALEPRPRLVETSLPRMMLASYGIAINPETAGDNVRAQMLVSAAGQPLALRFAQ